ncbi:MAG: [protein-PII] uridylyltransferase [Rhodanobacter sp.]|jgi:[protein-PII] uridylyltransferase|nr:[protein-PII] uridylyltransferase [Rhodanobacter sp.]
MNGRSSAHPFLPGVPRLPAALPRSGVSAQARIALRQMLGDTDRELAAAFGAGVPAGALVKQRAEVVQRSIVHVWQACVGDAPDCALFAIGGFGRGLLFPHSDVDLLVLATPQARSRQTRALEAFLACLWDIGLQPSHALRTLPECRDLAAADVSVFTALLDGRRLAGDRAFDAALTTIIDDPEIWPAARFLAAKCAEQDARYARYGDTTYNLEPNLKGSPGGLRTLDLMRWLGRRVAGAGDFAAMVARDLLDASECAALERAQAVLWRCRYALHLAAGRAEERLLFDYQRPLAEMLGYRDEHAKNLAVEQFMQRYFRAATLTERLCVQFIERCIECLELTAPAPRELDRDFLAVGPRIELRDPELFLRQPRAMIDIFTVQLDHRELRGLSAQTMRLLQQALAHHGEDFAADAQVLTALLALLRRGAPAVEALASMNRHCVLAAVLPPFQHVVGRMQYDLFHVYTVDEHTLRVLHTIARCADPQAATVLFSATHRIFAELEKPELLLLAALLHDIAKGRGGNHAQLGEEEARTFCHRLALPEADVELVAWLVRWHLLMSTTAQRQDINDPEVVHHFASQVADHERLDLLYLLTIADIAGTNPTLWNEWKARLLADLYTAARFALSAGLMQPPHAQARMRDGRERTRNLLTGAGIAAAQAEHILARFPAESFLRLRPEQIAWQAHVLARATEPVAVALRPRPTRGSNELFVHAPDRHGLLAAIAATLDRLDFAVASARLFVAQGSVFDTFELLDSGGGDAFDDARARELEAALSRALTARDLAARVPRRNLSRQLRHFQHAPQIGFAPIDEATQLALVCSDRPGLLAQITQALRDARVRVRDARIATFGERVEDFFILTDPEGRALTCAMQERLRTILNKNLGATAPSNENRHATPPNSDR